MNNLKNACSTNDPTCESRVQHDLVAERTTVIIRNIESGNNECGTLMCGGQLNTRFVAAAVEPVVRVCVEETDALRRENATLRADIESKRRALESAVANIVPLPHSVMPLFREALPGHPHLS